MKKIILVLCLLISVFTINSVDAVGEISYTINNDVEGYLGIAFLPKTVNITINSVEGYVFDNDKVSLLSADEFRLWFKEPFGFLGASFYEIPDTLTVSPLTATGNTLPVQFTGPYKNDDVNYFDEVGSNDICVYIPAGYAYYMDGVNKVYNEDIIQLRTSSSNAHYIIKDYDVYYTYDYTVTGYVGEEIEPQEISVTIEGNLVMDDLAVGEELPSVNGLTVTISEVNDNGKEIIITYTGTPLDVYDELIHTTFDKDLMDPDTSDIVVEDDEDVNILITNRPKPKKTDPVYEIPRTGID